MANEMKKKAAITYSKFLDRDGTSRVLGGVETYILYLGRLLIRLGFDVEVFQSANTAFETGVEGIKVIGVCHAGVNPKALYEKAHDSVSGCKGLLIFGADQHSVKTDYPHAINIMHGIAWDLPAERICSAGGRYRLIGKIPFIGPILAKHLLGYIRLKQIENTKYSVLVDYNSINWYRTHVSTSIASDYKVILNFVDLPNDHSAKLGRHDDEVIKIVFARRFHIYRGTNIMAGAIERLLKERSNIEVVFAGEGPEERVILERFKNETRVSVTSYLPENSIEFHQGFHIAVVPSLASEGSSLSLAEAMGAGCAVIASDVGGMTNMVINGYNGILVKPDVEELYGRMIELVDDVNKRKLLAGKGVETAVNAFSLSKWEGDWQKIIEKISA